jgi:hypothetical protein
MRSCAALDQAWIEAAAKARAAERPDSRSRANCRISSAV